MGTKDGLIQLRGLSQSEVGLLLPPEVCLLGYRGSISHGMYADPNKEDTSTDDKDIMGVAFAPTDCYLGMKNWEQKQVQLKEWDSVVYEIRKFFRLLSGCNPNVLSLLWLKPNHYIFVSAPGHIILGNRKLFLSRRIYHTFAGYAHAQIQKMTHNACQGYMGEKRKALVERFGYDTKNASHAIRLLRMGIEALREGELFVERKDAPQLLEIKRGEWTLQQVKDEADRLLKRLEEAYDATKLPQNVDMEKINDLLVSILKRRLFYTFTVEEAKL